MKKKIKRSLDASKKNCSIVMESILATAENEITDYLSPREFKVLKIVN